MNSFDVFVIKGFTVFKRYYRLKYKIFLNSPDFFLEFFMKQFMKLQFQVWGLGLRFVLFAFPDFTILWKTTFLFHSHCSEPTDKRIFVVAAALKQGYTVEKLYQLTKEFIIFFYIVIFYTTFIIYPLFILYSSFILYSTLIHAFIYPLVFLYSSFIHAFTYHSYFIHPFFILNSYLIHP